MAYINNGDTGSSIRDKWNKGISVPLTHSKTGTVHTLYGVPTGTDYSYIVDFQATADFIEGDTFSINDEVYTSQTQNGDALTGEYFKTDGWITGVKVDTTNKVLNFKSGGGVNATLPPLHTNFTAKGGNETITLTFDDIPSEYSGVYKETVFCLKAGGTPASPSDWDVKVVRQPDNSFIITRR